MLTPNAFIGAPGSLSLDVFGQTIGKEPNFLSFAEEGIIFPRTRVDGPVVRLSYVPSERAEFTAEFNGQTFAIKDPRYKKTISDWGDATLRAKLGLAKGVVGSSPAAALQFEVTLPNTSFGNGLGPNTIRLASTFLLGYKTERVTLSGNAGIAIEDEPLRLHEQRDFVSLSGSIAVKVSEGFEIFGDGGGYLGKGVPGAISRREVRAGFQYHRDMFGRATSLYIAGRRGLVDFQGKWGVVVGLTTALRSGGASREVAPQSVPPVAAPPVAAPPVAPPPMVAPSQSVASTPASGRTISGVVVSSQGVPIPGAEVSLQAADSGSGVAAGIVGQTVLTDNAGQFRFDNLAPATYTVSAVIGAQRSSTIFVPISESQLRVDIRVEVPGGF